MVASEIFLKKGDGDCKEICRGVIVFIFIFYIMIYAGRCL